MKLVIDMCLPPALCAALGKDGHHVAHWSSIGQPTDADVQIMAWALRQEHVIITHDLDFGDLLAASGAKGPSVIIVREQDVAVSITKHMARLRSLPIRSS
jgi:predicted nuclease of predicted toxin-antitoxin system